MIDGLSVHQKFGKCASKYGVYVKNVKSLGILLIYLFVDDLLITGGNMVEITNFKE